MKNKLMVVLLVFACVGLCFACGMDEESKDYLRIHIRANSNSLEDQNVKYEIKEDVVEFLTPYIIECATYEDVVDLIESKKSEIEKLCDSVLRNNGFDYSSEVKIDNEYFPTRAYQDLSLEANFYDALIINLGTGEGDNWWCVVYPPLCFKDTKNVIYKSKIVELINKFFK